MFDALVKCSRSVPSAYHLASEFKDLHLGDLHLIEIKGQLLFLTFLCSRFILSFPLNCLILCIDRSCAPQPTHVFVLITCHVS